MGNLLEIGTLGLVSGLSRHHRIEWMQQNKKCLKPAAMSCPSIPLLTLCPLETRRRWGARIQIDLANDIGERNDPANQRHDVARRLRPLQDAWEKEMDAEAALNAP